MTFLKGKLTYIVAGLNLLWAIYGYFQGFIDGTTATTMILASVAVFGIRRALPR